MASPCPHCGSTEGSDHHCGAAQVALIGQVLDGRYRIEQVIGQGGMGLVFRAIQMSVGRSVAVKTLYSSLATAPQFFERFRREAEIASRLHHPNVITIYDFGRAHDGTCYYVMEMLHGESLRELVRRKGPMSLRRAVNVIEQACRGLAHAHEQHAIHRDIKPHNIMVQQLDGRDFVKVLDFGLVKAIEQEEEDEQLTSTGQVLGTPQYMPPEQAGGEDVDNRSDLYSMGAVFYFCLTGTSPFGANTVRKALTASLTQGVPTVASKRQGAPVPQSLEDFFQKALAREKEERFQSAQEFIDAMLNAVAHLSPEELDARPIHSDPDPAGDKPNQSTNSNLGLSSQGGARALAPVLAPRSVSRSSLPRSVSPPSGVAVAPPQANPFPAAPPPRERTRSLTRSIQVEPQRGPLGKRIALVAVPLVLIAAGGAFVVKHSSSPGEPPPPKSEAKIKPGPAEKPAAPSSDNMILVKIRSTPSGATVFHGDVQLGTTPQDRRLRRDELHELTFQLANHQELKRKLDFTSVVSDEQEVNVTLEPVKPVLAEPSRSHRAAKQGKGKDVSIDNAVPTDNSVPIFE